jgi:hypothetical protein
MPNFSKMLGNYPMNFIAGLGAVGMAAGAMSDRNRGAKAVVGGGIGMTVGAMGASFMQSNNVAVARGLNAGAKSTMNAGFRAAEAFSARGMSKAAAYSMKGALKMGKGMQAMRSIL